MPRPSDIERERIIRELGEWSYWPLEDMPGKIMRVYCPLCAVVWERGRTAEHDADCPIGRAAALLAAEGLK